MFWGPVFTHTATALELSCKTVILPMIKQSSLPRNSSIPKFRSGRGNGDDNVQGQKPASQPPLLLLWTALSVHKIRAPSQKERTTEKETFSVEVAVPIHCLPSPIEQAPCASFLLEIGGF